MWTPSTVASACFALVGWVSLALLLAGELTNLLTGMSAYGTDAMTVNILTDGRAWFLAPLAAVPVGWAFVRGPIPGRYLAALMRVVAVYGLGTAATMAVVILMARADGLVGLVTAPLYLGVLTASAVRMAVELRRLAPASRFPVVDRLR